MQDAGDSAARRVSDVVGEEPATKEALLTLLKRYPAERMRVDSVSTRVNSVKNDDAGLVEPMMAAMPIPPS
jgi:hypothetical protein